MKTLPERVEIELGLDEPQEEAHLRRRAARQLGVDAGVLPALSLLKRSLDARRGRPRFRLLLAVGAELPSVEDLGAPHPQETAGADEVILVGAGPAGLFCAYELARHGIGCTLVDRGKPVQPRRRDLKGLNRHGRVDPDSNYCFGEGGAGTYSDGKLYTRSHKRGSVRDVIEILARHGAPPEILTEARPHIGSNRLPDVVTALRRTLEGVGVRFRFGARVTDLLLRSADGRRAVGGVRLADGTELEARSVVLATGHSAGDVAELLERKEVRLEAKPFAVGVRIEHPQPLIDRIQYGAAAGHPVLPSAAYALKADVQGRGVFSFCMCPGGWVVSASTREGELVVNGMSLSKRDSPFANSGLVVAVAPEDVARAGHPGPLGGVRLQRALEAAAFRAGGGGLRAPATRATDFLAGRASSTVPHTSYVPGITGSDVGAVLDAAAPFLTECLRAALGELGRKLRGYVTDEAVLIGVESRTSSPLRVPRNPERLESPDIAGLYPCGEGAGYAGGIMSAAMDGMRVARRIAAARAL